MLPLAFLAIAGGLLLLTAGVTGSSLASVVQGHPDGANTKTPTGQNAGGGPAAGVTGSTGPSSQAETGSGSVSHEIVTFFMGKGLTRAAAAGIAGNAAQESADNPNAPGGGLLQTIGGRGVPQGSSLHAQLESAWREIVARGEVQTLNRARTPEEAARIFQNTFEKPNPSLANTAHREQAAREAYG